MSRQHSRMPDYDAPADDVKLGGGMEGTTVGRTYQRITSVLAAGSVRRRLQSAT